MSLSDINARYLTVGYRRRDDVNPRTPLRDRPVMGRKGIGKLSLFSIARVVEVYTVKSGEKHGFRMKVADIKDAISGELANVTPYRPEPLPADSIDFSQCTRIILRDLKKNVTQTESALRRRLVRRFSIIDPDFKFSLSVNDAHVSAEDRDHLRKLQYVWVYGDDDYVQKIKTQTTNAESVEARSALTASGAPLRGWIGTVFSAGQLREQGENLKGCSTGSR